MAHGEIDRFCHEIEICFMIGYPPWLVVQMLGPYDS